MDNFTESWKMKDLLPNYDVFLELANEYLPDLADIDIACSNILYNLLWNNFCNCSVAFDTKEDFYRKFYFAGKPINFSGTQTDKNFRLFRKSKCRYVAGKKVHETLEVNGTVGVLENKLLHYSVADYDSYREKMIHYGQLKGKELFAKGKKYNRITQYSKTAFKFFKTYFIRLGFLDGKEGFQLAELQTLSVFETYNSLEKEEKNQ